MDMKSSLTRKDGPVIRVPKEQRTSDLWERLNYVLDPEMGVGVVDLGLIYNIDVEEGIATVDMTFTSMGCPAGPEIVEDIEKTIKEHPGIKEVVINIVWEPVWGPDFVDEEVRMMLWGQ